MEKCKDHNTSATPSACDVLIAAREVGVDEHLTTKVRVLSAALDTVSSADPNARFVAFLGGNIAVDFTQKITWTSDGRITVGSTAEESKAVTWITGTLDFLGHLVGAVVGAGSMDTSNNPQEAKDNRLITACIGTASRIGSINKELTKLSLEDLANVSRDSLEWTRAQLMAERADLSLAFTGPVTLETGTGVCTLEPSDSNESWELFKVSGTEGIDDVNPRCVIPSAFTKKITKTPTTYALTMNEKPSMATGLSDPDPDEPSSFWYRIPAIFHTTLTATRDGGTTSLATHDFPIPQRGVRATVPRLSGRSAVGAEVTIDPATGMLTALTLSGKALDLGTASASASGFVDTLAGLDTKDATAETERLLAEIALLEAQQKLKELKSGETSPNGQ